MHYIEVTSVFSASHQLRLPGGQLEPLHGHDWHVTVQVGCQKLDAIETVIDFHVLQDDLAALIAPWRNSHLNDHEPFKSRVNPSAERVAEEIANQLSAHISANADCRARGVTLTEVRITEAHNCLAIWRK